MQSFSIKDLDSAKIASDHHNFWTKLSHLLEHFFHVPLSTSTFLMSAIEFVGVFAKNFSRLENVKD